MKNKGFTLIELLAVIVILAIIALIATPIILGIIKDSEKKSKEISVKNYIDAVEQAIVRRNMKEEYKSSKCEITDGKVFCDDSEIPLEVQVDGETPKEGTIVIENGTVTKVVEKKGNKYIIYENGEIVHNGEIPEPVSFKEDSWKTISLNVQAGNIEVYKKNLEEGVNNTKTVDMGIYGTHTVRIANTSTPDECSAEGFSQTACGFVVEFEDIITTHNMNSTTTNVGGYPASEMYTFIKNDIYNSLPQNLKGLIIDTKVVSSHGTTSGEINFVSEDKLYLLSTKEVYGKEGTSNVINNDTAEAETRQLDYYKDAVKVTTDSYLGAIKKYNGNANFWWLRSVYYSSIFFYPVNDNGGWNCYTAGNVFGVSPAFRIG